LGLTTGCFVDQAEDDDGTSGADTEGEATMTGAEPTASASGTSASSTTVSSTSASSTTASGTNATSTTADTDDLASTSDAADATTEEPASSSSSGTPEDELVLDFALTACGAEWSNDLGQGVACPTLPGDPAASNGSVFRAEDESIPVDTLGITLDADAIAVHPRWATGGRIVGRYDAIDFEAGDVFRAEIACVQDVFCEVDAILAYATDDGTPESIDIWHVTFEDVVAVEADVEIPESNGPVSLVLIVDAGETSASDATAWIAPRVVRPAP
jgi:hypothetical protein